MTEKKITKTTPKSTSKSPAKAPTSKVKPVTAASTAGSKLLGSTSNKALSKVNLKKIVKAARAAKKEAGKTQVRLSRSIRRADQGAKSSDRGTKRSQTKGQAPQSARISPQKGNMQSEASRTQFVPKYSKDRNWLIVDAADQTVGRLASQIAMLLRGKHKASFTPNNDAGDFVVVINASQIHFSSNKEESKKIYNYSGWIGGLKIQSPADLRKSFPERILYRAVRGMVPRSPLGRDQMAKLKIYAGKEHPHAAQKPVAWALRHNTGASAT